MTTPPVSSLLTTAFNIARSKYFAEHQAWVNFAYLLAGRFKLPVAVISIPRGGELDLLLRCMEDEFEPNRSVDFAFYYQLTLSEAWVVGCYEVLRAFRQRDYEADEAGLKTSGVSELKAFKSVFVDFELLRMPMAKYEIAKDKKMPKPLRMRTYGEIGEPAEYVYDPDDPARHHIMPTGVGQRGSVMWQVLDPKTGHEYWVDAVSCRTVC
jgi:hypothetical protein